MIDIIKGRIGAVLSRKGKRERPDLTTLRSQQYESFVTISLGVGAPDARSLMLGNVRCRYPEVDLFMFPPKNFLLPNLPELAEYEA
jgi:hypothetical protein